MNYFEVFGLERKLGIDAVALQTAFYDLNRQWHPDRQRGLSPDAQADALARSALVNAAYRALRDPIARIEYLVRLEEGRDTREGARPHDGAAVTPKAPAELLEEMFEIQEMLAEARAGGLSDDARERLSAERDRLAARRAVEEARLAGPLSAAWDAAAPNERARALDALKEALATRAYLGTVVDDLTAALSGPGEPEGGVSPLRTTEESHVAHHRH